MNRTIRTRCNPYKIAENCGFQGVSLPIIKELRRILKHERAHRNRVIFRALFCSARNSHERFILPNLDVLSECGSIAQHIKRGQDIAFALFLGNIS